MSNRFLRAVSGRYDFRRRIPPALVPRFGGQQELIRSIGSVLHAVAMEQIRRLAVASDRLFRMVRQQVELSQQQIEELAREYFARTLAGFDKGRQRYSEGGAAQAQRRLDGAKEQLRMGFLDNAAPNAIELLNEKGLPVVEGSEGFKELCRLILRAYVEVARIHEARYSGDYSTAEADPLFRGAEADAKKATPKFATAFDLFVAEKVHKSEWGPDQQRDNRNTKAMFVEWSYHDLVDSCSARAACGFELNWANAAQMAVTTDRIVEAFDVFGYVQGSGFAIGVDALLDSLLLALRNISGKLYPKMIQLSGLRAIHRK